MASDEPMSDERLAEIRARVEAATKGYWIAGTLGGDLMYRGALGPARIARIDATDGHKGVADLLYHAYDDLSALLTEVERLRAREAALVEIAAGAARLDDRVGIECGCRLVMALGHYDDCWVFKAQQIAHTTPSGEMDG